MCIHEHTKVSNTLQHLLQLRKINKMKCDGDTEWTDKLQRRSCSHYPNKEVNLLHTILPYVWKKI